MHRLDGVNHLLDLSTLLKAYDVLLKDGVATLSSYFILPIIREVSTTEALTAPTATN